MMKYTFLLFTIAAMIYAIATPVVGCGDIYGKPSNTSVEDGWEPIKDINDKLYQELGDWAVKEFLKHVNCMLEFNEVVSGKENVVSTLRYEFLIGAVDESRYLVKYKAEVYEDGWTRTRKLIYFGMDD